MVWIVFVMVLVVIAAGLIWLMSQEADYEVRRSRLFDQDVEQLFDKIRDFRSWPDWSPWLMHEPDTRLEYSDNCDQEGGYYNWDGQRIGAGRLTHVRFERPGKIEQQIQFTRPFKSVCQVSFEFTEKDGSTEVCWSMKGRMPFLFRFMTRKTVAMISQDYDLGLAMLAGQLDPTTDHPRIEFHEQSLLEPRDCLCEGFSGGIEAMQSTMQAGFPRLMEYAQQQGDIMGPPLTVYHHADPEKMQFVCDMAVPVNSDIRPGSYSLKPVGGGSYFRVTLNGNYQFLGLAWYSAMAHVRMLKLKLDRSRPSLEVYENDPREQSDSNEWLTTLYIPVRS